MIQKPVNVCEDRDGVWKTPGLESAHQRKQQLFEDSKCDEPLIHLAAFRVPQPRVYPDIKADGWFFKLVSWMYHA